MMVRELLHRIQAMIGFALVRSINASGGIQLMQVKMGSEVLDKVPYVESYGFTAVPQDDAECLVASLGGNRNRPVVLAVGDRRYRLKGLAKGEVAMYTDEGDCIHIKRGGVISVSASTRVEIDSPTSTFSGNVDITGNLAVAGESTAADHISDGVSGKSHTHAPGTFVAGSTSVTGDSGAPQ